MRKMIAVTAALVAVIMFGGPNPVATAATLPTGPVVFFVPHQDDDVLLFGSEVITSLAAGRDVIEVLMTDGSSTGVCANSTFYKSQDGNPSDYSSYDRAYCTQERDDEFQNAAAAYNNEGVSGTLTVEFAQDLLDQCGAHNTDRQGRIRCEDNSLTVPYAETVMQNYVDEYPDGSFKTTTAHELEHCDRCANDPNVASPNNKADNSGPGEPDHGNLGVALENVSGTADKRYFLRSDMWHFFSTLGSFGNRHTLDADDGDGSDEELAYECGDVDYPGDVSSFTGQPCIGGASTRLLFGEQHSHKDGMTTADTCYPHVYATFPYAPSCYNNAGADTKIIRPGE